MRSLLLLLVKNPRAGAIFSVGGFLMSSALFGHAFVKYNALPPSPVEMTMAEAMAEAQERDVWVVLTDGVWRCDLPVVTSSSGNSYVSVSNRDRSRLAVATLSRGGIDCSDLRGSLPTGVLGAMSPKRLKKFTNEGLVPPGRVASAQSLCCYCGRGNWRMGLAVFGMMGLAALSMFPILTILRRKMQDEGMLD